MGALDHGMPKLQQAERRMRGVVRALDGLPPYRRDGIPKSIRDAIESLRPLVQEKTAR
jgi:hypothetical protein